MNKAVVAPSESVFFSLLWRQVLSRHSGAHTCPTHGWSEGKDASHTACRAKASAAWAAAGEKMWRGGSKAINQCPEHGWLLSSAAKVVCIQSPLLWKAHSELNGICRFVGKKEARKERRGVRRRSLYKSPKPFVFILRLLPPICSFSNWKSLFFGSKPHQLCGAVTNCVFITVQCGTIIVCKIPAASQKMSLCRELLLALWGEEDAGGNAGEELSLCTDITVLLSKTLGKKSMERKEMMRKRHFMNLLSPLGLRKDTQRAAAMSLK